MKFRLNRVMRLAALSAATTLGMVGQSHAALYQGAWDPVFGPPFTGLAWKATGTLYVSSGCGEDLEANPDPSGAVSFNSAAAAQLFVEGLCYGELIGGVFVFGIRLQNILVQFYNVTDPLLILRTLSIAEYGWGSLTPDDIDGETQFLTSVAFQGIVPTAFQTSYSFRGSLSTPAAGSCTNDPFTGYSYSARLGSAPITSGLQYYCDNDENDIGVATGRSSFQPSFVLTNEAGDRIIENNPLINAVPEPGTLALAVLALAGAVAARRRKRN